jgi:hypothetical protein
MLAILNQRVSVQIFAKIYGGKNMKDSKLHLKINFFKDFSRHKHTNTHTHTHTNTQMTYTYTFIYHVFVCLWVMLKSKLYFALFLITYFVIS